MARRRECPQQQVVAGGFSGEVGKSDRDRERMPLAADFELHRADPGQQATRDALGLDRVGARKDHDQCAAGPLAHAVVRPQFGSKRVGKIGGRAVPQRAVTVVHDVIEVLDHDCERCQRGAVSAAPSNLLAQTPLQLRAGGRLVGVLGGCRAFVRHRIRLFVDTHVSVSAQSGANMS